MRGRPPDAGGAPVRQTFNLNLGQVGSVVNTVTQFAEKSSTKAFKQNGYTMGYMEGFKIDQSGKITGVFTNGSNRLLGQIALGELHESGRPGEGRRQHLRGNEQLRRRERFGERRRRQGQDDCRGAGDEQRRLAQKFADMIVTQRGFEANTKTIQTSDQMLQDILTLKR